MSPRPWFHAAVAVALCCSLITGCAARSGRVVGPLPPTAQAAIAEFAGQLPRGSRVHVERVRGRSIRGTLIKVTPEALTIQPRTRLPEPPVEIAISDVIRLQPETSNGRSLGKAIGIGAAAGAGAALGFFLFLLAIFD